jgi:hypothetical protein
MQEQNPVLNLVINPGGTVGTYVAESEHDTEAPSYCSYSPLALESLD